MKKKNYIYIFLLIFFIFAISQLVIMRSKNLSGDSMSRTLINNSFNKFHLEFLSPDDWILFDTSESSQYKEGIQQNLIIDGGNPKGAYPWLEIYLFTNQTIENIIQSDVNRINSEYQNNSINIVEVNNGSGIISYNFVDDKVFFERSGRVISCKDWVGEKLDRILIFSICATEEQWAILDEQFDRIINSITILE